MHNRRKNVIHIDEKIMMDKSKWRHPRPGLRAVLFTLGCTQTQRVYSIGTFTKLIIHPSPK